MREDIRSNHIAIPVAVLPGAYIRHIGFSGLQALCGPEVAELKDEARRVHEKILRLHVAMTDAHPVDVRKRSAQLVHVDTDHIDRHRLLGSPVTLSYGINGLRDEVKNQI
jgi:hypothetical protein